MKIKLEGEFNGLEAYEALVEWFNKYYLDADNVLDVSECVIRVRGKQTTDWYNLRCGAVYSTHSLPQEGEGGKAR